MTTMTMRRTAAAAAAALLTVSALAACATPATDPVSTEDTETTAALAGRLPAGEGTTQYPLTVTTATGETTIPERPERISMASSWDGDLFAALGVAPVSTDDQIEFYPWTLEAFPQEVETMWPVGDELYPAETIAASTPELIVDTLASDPAAVEKISAIAPVLGAPEQTGADSTWQQRILLLGEVLDLSDRAQQVIDDYDATFESIRTEHPEFADTTVDYVAFYGSEFGAGYLNTTGSDAEAFFTKLGFATNPDAEPSAFDDGMSDELWGTLTGDVLVISNQDAKGFDEFYSNPLIQGLESVQSGRVVILDVDPTDWTVTHDGEPTGFVGHFGRAFNYGPLAHLELAELVTPLVAEVLQ